MLTDKEIKKLKGLSQNQAEIILKNYGYNQLPNEKDKKIWHIFIEVIREPMLLLLVACSSIYFALGDMHEAVILFSSVFLVVGITIYQENKTEKALFALRNLASPRALVIRDGEYKRIAGREVVKGDYVVLNEGDRVPADGIILWAINLFIDESILTGESLAVEKSTGTEKLEVGRPAGDTSPFAYSGSLVTSGQGIMLTKKTGQETEMGKIGKMLNIIKDETTPLQKESKKIVKTISFIVLLACFLVVIFYFLRTNKIIEGFLAGLTLAMAILPEELPVVMTIFLAIGAWRISKKQVLTRTMSAVETLGSASVLCVDKTGTLTKNKMQVEKIYYWPNPEAKFDGNFLEAEGVSAQSEADIRQLGNFACLSCKKQTFDPMDAAIKEFSAKMTEQEKLEEQYEFLREYPLSHKLLAIANVWLAKDGSTIVATKGAPEAIGELCHLNKDQTDELLKAVKAMAAQNLRILAVARAQFSGKDLPGKMHDFDFELIGLIGLADPIRPTVPKAIKECYEAGIKIIMITGDYQETAKNIARQIGLKNIERTITGEEFDMMSDEELLKRLQKVTIFSRMVPTQKLRIVEALKKNGEIVAMTGDGVNDAPALKSANIGIAMGERGTDVSREAADIVLLDDNFSSLVASIKVGRRIFDNLKKAVAYIFAIHVPIAGISIIPIILNWPLILYPVHVVFLELIIDPVCSILFEAEPAEKNVMRRPPRDRRQSLLDKKLLSLSLGQGFSILLVLVLIFAFSMLSGKNESQIRALIFTTLIFANLFLILSSRSQTQTISQTIFKKNPTFWWIAGSGVTLLVLINCWPALNKIFKFSILNFYDFCLAFFAGLLSLAWLEIYKFAKRKTC